MILANENIDHRIIVALRADSYAVSAVYEMQRGLTEEEIITLSGQPPQLMLTEDKDFGE